MTGDLATTNLLLGIMAAVSVLEALLVIGVAVAAWTLYRRATQLVETVEARHVAPLAARLHAVLDDVRDVTATIKGEADRVERVRSTLQARTRRIVSIARGLRYAVQGFLHAA